MPSLVARLYWWTAGRFVAFAAYGDPEGKPVLHFHGLPGSRFAWGLLPGDALPPDLRIIAPDRPGCGNPDAKPGQDTA